MNKVWVKANEWERSWWGDCSNTIGEEIKQFYYATLMGLDSYKKENHKGGFRFDLRGKSVLDIGGGPVSLLLKCGNFKKAVVVDPCNFPKWVGERYKTHNIEFINKPAEEIDLKDFDEVWIYNCLQHTKDPEKIIKNALKAGKVVRIFEWINTGTNEGHITNLTKGFLDKYFRGRVEKLNKHGCFGDAYIATLDKTKKVIKEFKRSKVKRFHLLGVAHLPTNKKEAIACAYSQKVFKMAQMLKSLGHEVYFYGVEGSTVECDEFIQVVDKATLTKTYGNYDYKNHLYKFDPNDLVYQTFNKNAIKEINKRKQERDYLLISMGTFQKPIADAVNISLTVEMGIGYRGIFAKYKVFESYAWMHNVYGWVRQPDGLFYDCVIPNYFDPKDFKYQEKKKDYFLFLGRMVHRKGIIIAKQTIEAIKGKLLLAGQKGEGGDLVDIDSPNLEHVGFADLEKRRELLAGAKALFCPTIYIEPFGGVIIEAAFSGTPVITTDWGVFGENVIHGKTGYRCRTLEQFIWAAKNIDKIKPKDCYDFAMKNFTMKRVAKMYDEYFNQLETVFGKGWYESNIERKQLDWLKKEV